MSSPYIADLHIHSPYSRATSKESTLVGLAAWARVKGIDLLGTGDFTHPGWFARINGMLEPAEPGFFRLKPEEQKKADSFLPLTKGGRPGRGCRFVLTAEISSIYKRHGRVRKVHNLLFVPDLNAAARINARLAGIGNIHSDGRPILGLDSRDLLEILLELAPEGFLVPAHIWTPWFSLFGSKSGFDSIEECFGDLSGHIFALETGLSSDPDMNRLVSSLDRFSLISNSDCHSPAKLGREANLFDTDFDFFSLRNSLKNPEDGFLGTIEFFPEEGKYHYDGHRKCGICLDPVRTREEKGLCPACGKPVTVGVLHRVLELADRRKPFYPDNAPRFHSLIPLPEVLAELLGRGPNTKGVLEQYWRVVSLFGSEFTLSLHTPVEEISSRYSPLLAEAISRIRQGRVIRNSGYDGEFGKITVFEEGERAEVRGQHPLFQQKPRSAVKKKKEITELPLFSVAEPVAPCSVGARAVLNPEQKAAVECPDPYLLVQAGPGTGKTHTLIARLAHVLDNGAGPAGIAVITFTNRAADEVRERLSREAGTRAGEVFVGTFHRFCLSLLRHQGPDLAVVGEDTREMILRTLFPGLRIQEMTQLREAILEYFTGENSDARHIDLRVQRYLTHLQKEEAIDLDGVIPTCVRTMRSDPVFRGSVLERITHLFVDEFQDLSHDQYALVRLFSGGARIFAIGDPDQAIYGFRGSSPRFFHEFARDCQATVITLVRNYRSAPAILAAAAAVIEQNSLPDKGVRQPLAPQSTRVAIPEYCLSPTPQAEAEYIVQRIEEALGGISHFSINSGRGGTGEPGDAVSFGDIAVLYRSSIQAGMINEALFRRGIPTQVVDLLPFYMRGRFRSLYFRVRAMAAADIPMNGTEYLSLLRDHPGIGISGLMKIEVQLPLGEISDFFSRVAAMDLDPQTRDILGGIDDGLRETREQIRAQGPGARLPALLQEVGIDPEHPDGVRFLEMAGSFGSDFAGFAGYLRRNSRGAVYDDNAESVALMTLHAAKGLEFSMVFITGCEEGVLPWTVNRQEGMAVDIEEERRLFYVGMTRAREALVLTGSRTRTIFGRGCEQKPSRFLAEIPEQMIRIVTTPFRRKKAAVQLTLF